MISMAFVTGPYSFYTAWLLLAVAEIGLTPGVLLFLRYWMPQNHRARYSAMFSYAMPPV
jgi:ACS family tartrate transporter-like MFS transporter